MTVPRFRFGLGIAGAWFLAIAALLPCAAVADGDPARGAYVFTAAGCKGCHTTAQDAKAKVLLAGGRALKTPFGTYFSPNITPDPETGIGRWSFEDFKRALRDGKTPSGSYYFPVFPYTAYTKMSDADMADLWAYLRTLPAVKRANQPHDTKLIFGWRLMMLPWRILNFEAGPMKADPAKGPAWNRGAYLVEALSHCGECHSPRDALGGFVGGMHLAGTAEGPGGDPVPNITPDKATGIGEWSAGDIDSILSLGMLPDGDFVGGEMTEVYENTSKLTPADRRAMVQYLQSIPAVENKVTKSK